MNSMQDPRSMMRARLTTMSSAASGSHARLLPACDPDTAWQFDLHGWRSDKVADARGDGVARCGCGNVFAACCSNSNC
jgi:hypothetical protein